MKTSKKIALGLASAASLLFLLTGCSSSGIKVKLDNMNIVVDEGISPAKGQEFLGLKLDFKNDSHTLLSQISTKDFTLYDSKGQKISTLDNIVSDDSSHSYAPLSISNLAAHKSNSGYVTFQVQPNQKYTLHYRPENGSNKDITLKIDSSKATDNTNLMQTLTDAYISNTFLGKSVSTPLTNNFTTSVASFKALGKANFTTLNFGPKNAQHLSSKQVSDIINSFVETNAKQSSASYTMNEMFPNYARVSIQAKTIKFSDLNLLSLAQTWANQNIHHSGDLTDAENKQLYAYLVQQIPAQLRTLKAKPETNAYILPLTKSLDNKWSIVASDTDTQYRGLEAAYLGN